MMFLTAFQRSKLTLCFQKDSGEGGEECGAAGCQVMVKRMEKEEKCIHNITIFFSGKLQLNGYKIKVMILPQYFPLTHMSNKF